jgi:hypothetical protein
MKKLDMRGAIAFKSADHPSTRVYNVIEGGNGPEIKK